MEIRLLGPVEVMVDGRPIALGATRQGALLALLASRPGRTIGTDRLFDEVWAGEPPGGAGSTLKSYVSRLRPLLGTDAVIQGSRDGYVLYVEPARVDARRFEAALASARSAHERGYRREVVRTLDDALGLWRGEAFGQLADLPALRAESQRLDDLRLEAIELRAEVRLATGHADELVEEIEALLAAHPYRERLWRLLMLALYHTERQADALAAYRRARAALDEEFGLEPGPELRSLERAILRHEVTPIPRAGARVSLPAPLTSFIGREAEIEDVLRLLGAARLVTVTGVGGVGKTRLATEAARRAGPEFPDGAVFVDLAPLQEPSLVAAQIAAAFDIREQTGTPLLERVASQLRDRAALVLLDNCEHVRDACAEIAERLLATAPGLRILATSREVLGVPGEATYATPPLGVADAKSSAEALRRADAVQLFLARARDARSGIPDDDTTIRTIGRICADLDGLPLGIELAAARARALSPADIAERLGDRYQFLVSWRRVSPARHRTLREAIDWSYDLLDAETRRLLAILSVFAGGFTLDAVTAVGTGGDEPLALRLLERLADASLVIVDARADTVRYRMLETIRQYAAERLAEAGDGDRARERLAEYVAAAVQEAAPAIRAQDPTAVARLSADLENIRAALTWCRETGDYDRMLRIADAVWWLWWMRGVGSEAREWMRLALEGGTSSPPALRAEVLHGLAGLSWAQGDDEAAERYGTAALRLSRELGDRDSQGNALNVLGLTADLRGDLALAQDRFEAALETYGADAPDAQTRGLLATVIDNLGTVAHELGDDERAIRLYEEARELNREIADNAAMNELHLAHIAGERGDTAEARRLIASALRWYAERDFVQYVAECLESASIVANALRDPTESAFLLGASAAIRDRAGTPPVPFLGRLRDRELDSARESLGEAAAEAAFREGAATPSDLAIARAQRFLEG